MDRLRQKFAPRVQQIVQRLRAAQERVERERAQYEQQKYQTAISFGATVLGAVFGRKLGSMANIGRATTAARGASRIGRERADVSRAQDSVETLQAQQSDLESQLESELAQLQTQFDPAGLAVEPLEIRARKADLRADPPLLVWVARP